MMTIIKRERNRKPGRSGTPSNSGSQGRVGRGASWGEMIVVPAGTGGGFPLEPNAVVSQLRPAVEAFVPLSISGSGHPHMVAVETCTPWRMSSADSGHSVRAQALAARACA